MKIIKHTNVIRYYCPSTFILGQVCLEFLRQDTREKKKENSRAKTGIGNKAFSPQGGRGRMFFTRHDHLTY